MNNLFPECYLSWRLSQVCIDFFWAAHHSATQHAGKMYSISTLICRTRITPPSPFKKGSAACTQRLRVLRRECRACLPCRVLATTICAALLCVSLTSELPGAGERQNSLPFQNPLHPMNRFAHKHEHADTIKTSTKPGRHGRARSLGRGEVLRCSKGLLSVPAIMPCAEL